MSSCFWLSLRLGTGLLFLDTSCSIFSSCMRMSSLLGTTVPGWPLAARVGVLTSWDVGPAGPPSGIGPSADMHAGACMDGFFFIAMVTLSAVRAGLQRAGSLEEPWGASCPDEVTSEAAMTVGINSVGTADALLQRPVDAAVLRALATCCSACWVLTSPVGDGACGSLD